MAVPYTIILVDDHKIVRDGIKMMLLGHSSFAIMGEAGSGEAFYELLEKNQPDIVVLDLKMPGESGSSVAEKIKQKNPDTKILILTAEAAEPVLRHCLRIGVEGMISKESGKEVYLEALEAIAGGRTYYGGQFMSLLTSNTDKADTIRLTDREIDVLKGFAEGKSYKQIAAQLHISTRTVETHKKNIREKLGATSTAELVKYALKEGIIS